MSGLIRCAACGVPMGRSGYPPTPAQIEHVESCEKHPAARLRRENDRLKRRLAKALTQGERYRAWTFGTNADGVWSRSRGR